MLQAKIPPPVIALSCIIGMYLTSGAHALAWLRFEISNWAAMPFFVIGPAIAGMALLQFRRVRTTFHPTHPERATSLVTSGIFQYTRNPMYLGLSLVLCGFVLVFGSWFGLLWIAAFVAYIQQFQIKPEEEAMLRLFGEQFTDYRKRARRWL